jgi:tetratricopeptide (TPR) repeat protein/predicted aspartyl protease
LRRFAASLIVAALGLGCGPAWAKCQLNETGALHVTMIGMRVLLPAQINGQDVQFVVDSGADLSVITPQNADMLQLPRGRMPFGASVLGVTGEADADVGLVKVLTLANTPLKNMHFVVGGGDVGAGAVGLLGQNILRLFDVEYDLAKGSIHFWSPKGCSRTANLGYWSGTAPESVIDLDSDGLRFAEHTKGPVYVNGVRLTAIFDTGSTRSVMTRAAAARAGIKPNDPGVVSARPTIGIGKQSVASWIAPVKSFKIGDEEIRDTKMLFSDIQLTDADMLLGADFFLAHHIFVSNQQHKLYLTYNGGPVFETDQTPSQTAVHAPALTTVEAAAGASQADPTDAAGFARRGARFADRNELPAAIADLGKAIEMAPTVADYPYQRGLVYLRTSQLVLAMADFDLTLKLKPNDVRALVARAALRLSGHDKVQALQDLDAADKASAKQDDIHLLIAALYASADLPQTAIDQYGVWIDAHSEDDSRLPFALNGRCWLRALNGVDLDKALNDCDRAIRNKSNNADAFNSRGLVRLRLGDLDKAIADYDIALAIKPNLSWSLYGRGLAKQRKGQTADGAADINAALAIDPKLADEAKKRGLMAGSAASPMT